MKTITNNSFEHQILYTTIINNEYNSKIINNNIVSIINNNKNKIKKIKI